MLLLSRLTCGYILCHDSSIASLFNSTARCRYCHHTTGSGYVFTGHAQYRHRLAHTHWHSATVAEYFSRRLWCGHAVVWATCRFPRTAAIGDFWLNRFYPQQYCAGVSTRCADIFTLARKPGILWRGRHRGSAGLGAAVVSGTHRQGHVLFIHDDDARPAARTGHW